ncbi:SUKH-4 family immunity protein [Streptomyces sp. CA-135486]|uniref:SUKH-4 family immunity protein n=1 Tax=Streptomyces sp. CA-135486 TaxID=3240049 RepID=UPI003D919310
MDSLLFELTYEELVSYFGVSRVHRSDRREAEALGFSGPTLEFLCTVGLPSTPKSELEAPGGECILRALDEMPREDWNTPKEAKNWIVFGAMPSSSLALDSVTGRVFGFYEGYGEIVSMHSDISSLAYAIYAVKKVLPEIALCKSYEERAAIIDAVRLHIAERDPLPFAQEDSEWGVAFDEIAMGMWT